MFRNTRLFLATTGEISAALAHMELTMAQAADTKTLRARYLDLTRRNHPDAGGDERTMRHVIEAFRVLGEVTPAEIRHYSAESLRQTQKISGDREAFGLSKGGYNDGRFDPKYESPSWTILPRNGHEVRRRIVQICGFVFVGWLLKSSVDRAEARKVAASAEYATKKEAARAEKAEIAKAEAAKLTLSAMNEAARKVEFARGERAKAAKAEAAKIAAATEEAMRADATKSQEAEVAISEAVKLSLEAFAEAARNVESVKAAERVESEAAKLAAAMEGR